MKELPPEAYSKLEAAQIIWVASVRPDGTPHLSPVWFAFHAGKLYASIDPSSVKRRNLDQNLQVALALEDGLHPVICEGRATPMAPPWPEAVLAIFQRKYDWDLTQEGQYNYLVEITPHKWLAW